MSKNKKPQKRWEVKHATLILFVKDNDTQKPSVLIGYKTNGPVEGWTMPPGGHVDDTDKDVIGAAEREGFEEVGLTAEKGKSRKVAELCVTIQEKNRKVIVHVVKCTSWTGELRVKDPNLTEVRFQSIHELPYHLMPTGEKEWLRSVFVLKSYCKVYITCGKNRRDVIRVDTTVLSESPF